MDGRNDARNWNRNDPRANLELNEIEPVSDRALSLLDRSCKTFLNDNYIQISGAISMMRGMDYHHENFRHVVSQILDPPKDSGRYLSAMRHEAVAWINRVGQFQAFSRSDFIKNHIGLQNTPRINGVMPFRNKHTAHRSIDQPRPDDTDRLKLHHAVILSDLNGVSWRPRKNISLENLENFSLENFFTQSIRPSDTHCPVWHLQLKNGESQELNIEEDHLDIMNE